MQSLPDLPGGQPAAPLNVAMLAALSPVDYGVLALYLGALIALGVYFSGRQRTSTEFLLASRSLGWLPLGMSLTATLALGLSLSELPGWAYEHGLKGVALVGILWLVLPIGVWLIVPLVRGLGIASLYEYLELRFDARVRVAASLLLIAWRLLWLGAVLHFQTQMLALASGGTIPALAMIVPLGIVASLYTFLGGARAATWAGAAHCFLLLVGALVVIGGLLWSVKGGAASVAELSDKLGRLQAADLQFDWTNRWTLWALLAHWSFAVLMLIASDQAAAQRMLSAKDVNAGRTAVLGGTLGLSLLWPIWLYAGLGLLAFFQLHPREMRAAWVVNVDGPSRETMLWQEGAKLLDPNNPADAVTWESVQQLVAERRILRPNDKQPFTSADELIDPAANRLLVEKLAMRKPNEGTLGGEYVVSRRAPEEMLPQFVATRLPWGFAGLALAALVAGWLAAFDATLGALGATIVFDLHRRCGLGRRWLAARLKKPPTDLDAADELQLARPLTLALGGLATGAVILVVALAGDRWLLIGIATALAAPLLGVMLLGMLTRRATSAAALTGLVIGVACSLLSIPLASARFAESWIIVLGTLLTCLIGYTLSFVLGRRKSNEQLRGLVAGCGTLGQRAIAESAPRIAVPVQIPLDSSDEGIRWK